MLYDVKFCVILYKCILIWSPQAHQTYLVALLWTPLEIEWFLFRLNSWHCTGSDFLTNHIESLMLDKTVKIQNSFIVCHEKSAHLQQQKKQSLIWWRNGWLYNMYVEGSWHNEAKQVIFTVSCLTSVGCLLTCQKARNCGSSITLEGEWAF